jgi:hypothetical protein
MKETFHVIGVDNEKVSAFALAAIFYIFLRIQLKTNFYKVKLTNI